jgi:hypothetical protein
MTTVRWCASILCMLLACTDGPPHRDPGIIVDPPYDAGVPVLDALDPATAVTVTVTLDGVPQPNVVVYFQSSYLGPSIERRTDATGSAIAVVEVPVYDVTSVTLVNPFGPIDATSDELFTYDAVVPGDHLQVARDRRPPPVVHVTLTAPLDPAAASYRLHTSCGAADLAVDADHAQVGGPVALAGCGATIDLLVESLDASGQSLGALYQADVPVSDGGGVALTGTYQPSHAKMLTYDTLSVRSSRLEIHARLLTAKGILYDAPTRTMALSFMNYHPSLTVMVPSIPGAVAAIETVYQSADAGLEHTIDWGFDAPRYELDLDSGPFLEQYVTRPELTSFGISYTETGGVVRADYVRARILAVRPGMRSWQWQFVSPTGPYGGGSQLWPQIPSDVYPYNRQGGDVWTVPEATLVYAGRSYDAIRAHAFSMPSPRALIAGSFGRVVFEDILPPGW